MFNRIEQLDGPGIVRYRCRIPSPCRMQETSLDEIIRLYANDLTPERTRELLQEMQNPDSAASRIAADIRRILQADIDISKIPGLEEIADAERRMGERDAHAS